MSMTSVFAPITKMEKQDDGSLMVTGVATDPTLDIDEQICDPEWLAKAMPDWFQWGNIREQHSHIAAGVATEYAPKGDKHLITAHVVDRGSVAKVEKQVLKGFSIGIRNPRVVVDKSARGGRIIDGQIVEVSLVDRPANPNAVLTLAKSAGSGLVQVEEFTTPGGDMSTTTAGADAVQVKTVLTDTTKDVMLAEAPPALDVHPGTPVTQPPPVVEPPVVEPPAEPVAEDPEARLRALIDEAIAAAEARWQQAAQAPPAPDGEAPPVAADTTPPAAEDDTPKAATLDEVLDAVKSLRTMLTTQVEATTEATEVTKALEARVTKVEKAPKPTAVRTAPKAATADDADALLAKATEYEAKAAETRDRTLAEGYRTLANEARAKAARA